MHEVITLIDRVIGLGANCETAANIRSHFGSERAYPFDWWVTPYRSLLRLLDPPHPRLFDSRVLEVSADCTTVRNTHYNILLHHDFTRGPDGSVLGELNPQLQALRQKYAFLMNRFYDDCQQGTTLFVRNRSGHDPHLHPDSDDIFEENSYRLYSRLARLFPDSSVYLLITNLGKTGSSDNGRIIWDNITDYHDADDYRISPRGWSELFERQPFRLAEQAR